MMQPSNEPKGWRRPVHWLLRQVERCFALIGLAMVVYTAGFECSRITSNSMAPTLQGTTWENGDRVLTERFSYWCREPRRWEVIRFRRKDGVWIIKRVVGLPGEELQMLQGGRIMIDGTEVRPPKELAFLKYFAFGNLTAGQKFGCGDGYYVLGDDSRDSDDSRFNGPVLPDEMLGRAWLILGPASRRGFVNP